jgi:hypothetical protein
VHRTLITGLATLALSIPSVDALAAASAPKAALKKIVAKRTFPGGLGQADRWGEVQVTIVVTRTTTISATKKTVKRHIDSIKVPLYPDHTDRSVFINNNSLPTLVQEAVRAQSAHINIVSGATYTSDAFAQSLQAAITKEKAW